MAAIVGAMLVAFSQYRLVIWPLKKLRMGVKNVTAKQFAARVEVRGDAEFSELAGEFNTTQQAQLEDLYRTLEAKVR